jgi:hypothetical protein
MWGTVIFALDDVLADPKKRRCHIEKAKPDWRAYYRQDLVEEDAHVPAMVALCKQLGENNEIVLVTDRPMTVSEVTRRWLHGYGIPFDSILWRQEYGPEDAATHKIAAVRDLKAGGTLPWLAVDCDPSLVAGYRQMGVTTLSHGKFHPAAPIKVLVPKKST